MFFQYGSEEIEYLKKRDKKLASVIEQVGHIKRTVDSDLFSSIVHHIIGQQISTKAQESIWTKINSELGIINADSILCCGRDKLQKFGITFKKADYILDFSRKVADGSFDLIGIENKSDDEIIEQLVSLKGIGVWTAEMILLFCLQRPDVFSFGDLAILRGLRMLYHHKEIDKERFEKYRRRFSPYCSVASLYLWAVAGGAIERLSDYEQKTKRNTTKTRRNDKNLSES